MRLTPRVSRRARRAFTILELLIVIGILLAIGGLVFVNLIGAQEKSEVGTTRLQMQELERGIESFRFDMKRWPTEEEGLAVIWSKEAIASDEDQAKYGGPYLKNPAPKDAWGREWIFHIPSQTEGLDFDIVSIGPDGEEGTEDDISNHDARKAAEGDDLGEFSGSSSSGTPSGG
ncbi:MAG: type II secretion system protein GspG [Phycisphaerales bacterium]|nr:type II secretion system protein GspG [Phycisphaerales bacterium]